jgi:2-amino-4-hydroxy-6-hydroxymethyldihydropteridine diphosphokinase
MISEKRAFIAFGANLGDAVQAYAAAETAIDALPSTRVHARSSLYRSAPVGVHGHPDYINAVLEVRTALAPRQLLDALLAIEQRHGRTRGGEVSPRTMDLDLLLFGDERIDSDSLKIPHPRMHLRAFVLLPLAELDRGLEIPGCGPMAQLLESVADQLIDRLPRSGSQTTMKDALP